MTNILPSEKRIRIERERWARMWTIGAILLLALIVLSAISLVPSYLLSRSKGEDAERQIELVKKFIELQEKSGVSQSVRETRSRMDVLAAKLRNVRTTEILGAITKSAPAEISFKNISMDFSNHSITVTGNAPSRNALLSFAEKLNEEKLFDTVDLPVSNLAKKNDIDFLLGVTLSEEPHE